MGTIHTVVYRSFQQPKKSGIRFCNHVSGCRVLLSHFFSPACAVTLPYQARHLAGGGFLKAELWAEEIVPPACVFGGSTVNDNDNTAIGESNEVETTLLSIVRELLHNDTIGPQDDFFLAGGHSLLGTQLVIRARKAFGVKIALRDLFENGTVARLAARIEELIVEEINSMSDEEVTRAVEGH
jgi:acyl carrier protein